MLDVWYLDQNSGVKINYLPTGSLKNKSLIQVMGLDKLSVNNQPTPGGDGVFDFLDNPMISIMPQNGKVIFPYLEPFGDGLKKFFLMERKLRNNMPLTVLHFNATNCHG